MPRTLDALVSGDARRQGARARRRIGGAEGDEQWLFNRISGVIFSGESRSLNRIRSRSPSAISDAGRNGSGRAVSPRPASLLPLGARRGHDHGADDAVRRTAIAPCDDRPTPGLLEAGATRRCSGWSSRGLTCAATRFDLLNRYARSSVRCATAAEARECAELQWPPCERDGARVGESSSAPSKPRTAARRSGLEPIRPRKCTWSRARRPHEGWPASWCSTCTGCCKGLQRGDDRSSASIADDRRRLWLARPHLRGLRWAERAHRRREQLRSVELSASPRSDRPTRWAFGATAASNRSRCMRCRAGR